MDNLANHRTAAFAAVSDLFSDPPPELARMLIQLAESGDDRAAEVVDVFGIEPPEED